MERLLARVDLLLRAATVVPLICSGTHSQVMLLLDFKEKEAGNPVERQLEIVEMFVSGVRRLGVKIPRPVPSAQEARSGLNDVHISPSVKSDVESDWQLLGEWAKAATTRSRALPPIQSPTKCKDEVASPANSSTRAPTAASEMDESVAGDDEDMEFRYAGKTFMKRKDE